MDFSRSLPLEEKEEAERMEGGKEGRREYKLQSRKRTLHVRSSMSLNHR